MKDLSAIRNEYAMASLDTTSIDRNPLKQFEKWLNEALTAELPEPTAMNLATLSAGQRPTSRIVLLKGIEQERFVFYTNYHSQKGQELEANPSCALNFFWPQLERQVRIEGVAERVDTSLSDAYFKSRPRGSQVGAWASPQSSIIKSREILEERVNQIELRFKDQPTLPRPHQWGGYAVAAHEIEFWQGRPNRLHDRIVYTFVNQEWQIHRLAP